MYADKVEIVEPGMLAKKPMPQPGCNCEPHQDDYTLPLWMYCKPECPPPPYPYPCPPCEPIPRNTIESQIAKLAKKASTIRKMINNLTNRNKPIIISCGKESYNFGCYMDSEAETTEYGQSIEEILDAELTAIKERITELTAELAVDEDPMP